MRFNEREDAHLIMDRSKELAKQQDVGGEADYARGRATRRREGDRVRPCQGRDVEEGAHRTAKRSVKNWESTLK